MKHVHQFSRFYLTLDGERHWNPVVERGQRVGYEIAWYVGWECRCGEPGFAVPT